MYALALGASWPVMARRAELVKVPLCGHCRLKVNGIRDSVHGRSWVVAKLRRGTLESVDRPNRNNVKARPESLLGKAMS